MDLSYMNARVSGWKAALLGLEEYDAFIAAPDLAAYMDHLVATPYGPDLKVAEARVEEGYGRLGAALRSSLMRGFSSLWKVTPEEARPFLKAVFSTWEAYDLKALMRGLDRSVGKEELFDALIPAGEFDTAALKVLSSARGVEDMVAILRSWQSPWAKPLKTGLPSYLDHHSLFEMEIAIDRFCTHFFIETEERGAANGEIIKKVVEDRADGRNVMTLLSAAGEGYASEAMEGFFIKGGRRLRRETFMNLSAQETRAELLAVLPDEINDSAWATVLASAGEEDLDSVAEATYELTEKELKRLSIVEPSSVAAAAWFIFAKVREVKTLRLIGRAKVFAIPDEEVRRVLRFG